MYRKNGFTLIETLMSSAVLMIFITAVLSIVQMSIQSLGEARVRDAATQLAQERLELARNLAYDRVGTIGGIPSGDLLQSETVTRLGAVYTLNTTVLYIDDPYDGVAPADILPSDYKRVRVSVTWNGAFKPKSPVVLMMDISPPGLESDNGGGTISIVVFNSQGQPIENAEVNISAPTLSPAINIVTSTDIFGRVMIPGAPVCSACYKISATKSGFSTERTYGMDEVANPTKPHLSVIKAQVSPISFAIDTLASLTLKTTRSKTSNYVVFSGVNLLLTGTKTIGTTTDGDPVYKVVKSVTSGSDGTVSLSQIEWDVYKVSVPPNSSIDIAGSWPFNPIGVNAGQNTQITVVVESQSSHSLLVALTNSTNLPLESAQVELSKANFIATATTGMQDKGDYSQVFFPNLLPNTYTLTISSLGYDTATSSETINGDIVSKYTLTSP